MFLLARVPASLSLLAQSALGSTVAHWLVIAIIIAGCIGIAYVVAKAAGIPIPPWVITILWIVLAVVIGVVAIKFLASML